MRSRGASNLLSMTFSPEILYSLSLYNIRQGSTSAKITFFYSRDYDVRTKQKNIFVNQCEKHTHICPTMSIHDVSPTMIEVVMMFSKKKESDSDAK